MDFKTMTSDVFFKLQVPDTRKITGRQSRSFEIRRSLKTERDEIKRFL
jgi:hypothetical protein